MMCPPIGIMDIVSSPPATITSAPPVRMRSEARAIDCRPEEQKRLIVIAEVSTKQLARHLGVKSVHPCDFASAQKHTGYLVGGTSPFGTRARLPVYAERTIFELPVIYINGGKRGFLVEIEPRVLRDVLPVEEVEVAIEKGV